MKTIIKFLNANPSYLKCSTTMIAAKTGISESTVLKFKASPTYKTMRKMYNQSLVK